MGLVYSAGSEGGGVACGSLSSAKHQLANPQNVDVLSLVKPRRE